MDAYILGDTKHRQLAQIAHLQHGIAWIAKTFQEWDDCADFLACIG